MLKRVGQLERPGRGHEHRDPIPGDVIGTDPGEFLQSKHDPRLVIVDGRSVLDEGVIATLEAGSLAQVEQRAEQLRDRLSAVAHQRG